jgi:hypothetical protein
MIAEADGGQHQIHELLWSRRQFRPVSEDLRLNVEVEGTQWRKIQDFIERWNFRPGHWDLRFEARILKRATVVLSKLGQR